MNNKGIFVLVSSVFLVLIIALTFTISIFGSNQEEKNKPYIENGTERISCEVESDCNDGDSCTLDYCGDKNFCVNTKVVLCYHSDGCCPQGCTPQNDNDCYGF
jgi:hypothetical protein